MNKQNPSLNASATEEKNIKEKEVKTEKQKDSFETTEATHADGNEESSATDNKVDDHPKMDNDEITKLKKEKEEAVNLYIEYKILLQKNQAEFENFKKRLTKEKEDWSYYAESTVLKELLSVADNFERALLPNKELQNKDITNEEKIKQLTQNLEGFEIIYKELLKIFKDKTIEKMEGVGSVFNPNFHQAIQQETSKDNKATEDVVSEVYQEGYLFQEKILRVATVKVCKKAETNN